MSKPNITGLDLLRRCGEQLAEEAGRINGLVGTAIRRGHDGRGMDLGRLADLVEQAQLLREDLESVVDVDVDAA